VLGKQAINKKLLWNAIIGGGVTLFDWLHDVTKGEDPLRPWLTKIGIAIIVIVSS